MLGPRRALQGYVNKQLPYKAEREYCDKKRRWRDEQRIQAGLKAWQFGSSRVKGEGGRTVFLLPPEALSVAVTSIWTISPAALVNDYTSFLPQPVLNSPADNSEADLLQAQ